MKHKQGLPFTLPANPTPPTDPVTLTSRFENDSLHIQYVIMLSISLDMCHLAGTIIFCYYHKNAKCKQPPTTK